MALANADASQHHRYCDVFQRCQSWDQVKGLEYEANLLQANPRLFLVAEPCDIAVIELVQPYGGLVEQAEDVEQR